jgi:hypothetical protein
MTAIRSKTTGEWIHNGPRATAPQFIRLDAMHGPRYRGEYLIQVNQITYINQSPDGYEIHVESKREPVVIRQYEYEHLIGILTDAGLVSMPAPDVEAL